MLWHTREQSSQRATLEWQGLRANWRWTRHRNLTGSPITTERLDRIGALYGIEREILDRELKQPRVVRHATAKSLLRQHAASRGVVIAGDFANNDAHLDLGASNVERRREWIPALDRIKPLNPRVVSPHIRDPKVTTIRGSSRPDNTSAISTGSWRLGPLAQELDEKMMELYVTALIRGGRLRNSVLAVRP